jgi:hypothetical protein
MKSPSPPTWGHLAQEFHDKLEETLERLADLVKDLMLDGGRRPASAGLLPDDLPPVPPEALVRALRDRAEAALRQAAEAVNAVGPGEHLGAGQEQVADVFLSLAREAFEIGLRLRLDAATRTLEPVAQGDWALRYRRMVLLEAAFPPDEDADG